MKPLKYNEIMPKVALEKLKLMEEQKLVDLAGKNLVEIHCALMESSYKEEIVRVLPRENNSIPFEEALLENYAKTLKNLENFSSGDLKKLIGAIIGKIEVSNIKTLLRATKAKMNPDEAKSNIIPVGILNKDRCQDILSNSKTIVDVIEQLFDTKYGVILQKTLSDSNAGDTLLPLESALDQAAYQKIQKVVKKFKGSDKLIAKNVLGIEVETKNIKIILRGIAKGISKDSIKKYLLPSFFISDQTVSKLLEKTDIKNFIEYLLASKEIANNPTLKRVFSQFLKNLGKPLSQIEEILEKASLKVSLEMQKKYLKYYNVSYVLVILNLKWIEIKNLRSIIVGSKRKINASKIRSVLTLQNNY